MPATPKQRSADRVDPRESHQDRSQRSEQAEAPINQPQTGGGRLDTRIFYVVNGFARDTPWLHPLVSGYANYGTVLFALLMLAV